MLNFWHHHGILGINARNLLYIKKGNSLGGIAFADDKLKTKQFLSARGVKTSKIIGKVSSEEELLKLRWESFSNDIVLKPNSGYGGEGIWILSEKDEGGWKNLKGEFIAQAQIEEHIRDILEGRYSITGGPDKAFFEERLICHPELEALGRFGLPDIRIIVFNLVPVMAMIRVPSKESDGKANLHMGGLGLGIDLAKGEVTHISHHHQVIDAHPDFPKLKGFKIPFWDEILLLSSEIQQKVTLGYLAVDIVVDEKRGPTLLEINARAGLSVQIANVAPLRERLDRVGGITVQTPEKGVRIAQDLFGKKIERRPTSTEKKVIGLEEEITFNLKNGTTSLMAKMNPMLSKNFLEQSIFHSMGSGEKTLPLNVTLHGKRLKAIFHPFTREKNSTPVILGRKILSNFYLDVSKGSKPSLIARNTNRPSWESADQKLCELDRKISLLSALRPINEAEAWHRFQDDPSYEPQFEYRTPKTDLDLLKAELHGVHIPSEEPFVSIFSKKRDELIGKIDLISVIGDDESFPILSHHQMEGMPEDIFLEAQESLKNLGPFSDEAPMMSSSELVAFFNTVLREKKLGSWKALEKDAIIARCMIGKGNTLLVRRGETFSQPSIRKLIAHEMETHIFCTENGKLQPLKLLSRGTAGYLTTQEGLAIVHQNQAAPDGLKMALLGIKAVQWGKTNSFRKVHEQLIPFLSPQSAFRLAVKVKRGLSDTGNPGAFYKQALYFWGYRKVSQHLADGGSFADLFLGKFALEDMALIKKIPGLQPPQFLPHSERFATGL